MVRKNGYIIIMLFIFILANSPAHLSAQEMDNSTVSTLEVGPGQEVLQVGNVNVVVPKGSKVRKEGAQIVVEDISAFVGRKLEDIDKRFLEMEDRQAQMQEDLDQLKELVNNTENQTLSSQKKE